MASDKETANVYRPNDIGCPVLYVRNLPIFVAKKMAKILQGWAVSNKRTIDYSWGARHEFLEVLV